MLVYHRIGTPPGDPRNDLVPRLEPRAFAAQLEHLGATYRVVPPSQLLEAVLERRPGEKFPVAVTFDDDLRSHAEVVAPALAHARLPAAFFLCGPAPDRAPNFWWEDLQNLVDRGFFERGGRVSGELDLSVLRRGAGGAIHVVAERIERLAPDRRDALAAELRAHAHPSPRLDARAISELAAAFEMGFHTRRHYLLTTLDDEALANAMTEGRDRLETLVGRRLTMIAYPHGKADDRVAGAARAAGFELCFTAAATAVRPTTDPLLIGRLDVASIAPAMFERVLAETLARARANG